jgi:hypothetical protein
MIVACAAAADARASGPLQTGVMMNSEATFEDGHLSFDRARAAGASVVRLKLNWRSIAPAVRPAGFRADEPAEPSYEWAEVDRQVRFAARRGLQPMLNVFMAPDWATQPGTGPRGTFRPDPGQLRLFTLAAVRRYSGTFQGLPRVRYWIVWNEPNLHLYLNPQIENNRPASPAHYRLMVNQAALAIRSVRGNVVVAGATAPFRDLGVTHRNWGPLGFMRELLCLAPNGRKTCRQRISFDVWSHHPYTSGGPLRQAVLPDDVSLGDLPEMKKLLDAAVRNGTVHARVPVRFWITEFSWDTSPPDPHGVPLRLHARWTAEALFRAWRSGVSLFTWLTIRDNPFPQDAIQAGLYFRGATFARDRPKPALTAFRFPFVAFPQHAQNRVYVWGRTPGGRPAPVLVEQQFRGGWKRLDVVQANRHGIFQARFASHRTGFVRARTLDRNERALPFSLAHVADRRFNPFGESPLEP